MIFHLENQCHIFVKGFSLKTPQKNKEWLVFNIIYSFLRPTPDLSAVHGSFWPVPQSPWWAKIATLDVG